MFLHLEEYSLLLGKLTESVFYGNYHIRAKEKFVFASGKNLTLALDY